MPIILINQTFSDLYGSSTNYLKVNTGDLFTFRLDLQESISVTSGASINIQNNPTTDIMTWLGGSWAEEGFRVGDTIDIVVYNVNTGAVVNSTSTSVDWIQDEEMKVASALSSWYDFQTEAVNIFVTGRAREGMELSLNFVANGSQGNEYSLIDGNATRFNFDMKNNPGPTFFGMQFGDRSGMFQVPMPELLLTSSTASTRFYSLTFRTTLPTLYTDANFQFNNCLKLYAKMSWESLLGEPFDTLDAIFNDDGDTGWFDMGFNSEPVEAVLVQGIDELAYDTPTTGTFSIDSTATKTAIGSGYVSTDESYYKNVPNSQSYLHMLIPTQVYTPNTPISSFVILGRGYDLTINSAVQTGTIWNFTFTFEPNSDFTDFIDSRPVGDRTMYIWAKVGNTNVLVFNGQMTKAPAVTKTLPMITSDYLDHGENVTNTTDLIANYGANIEDDIAFVGSWRNRFNTQVTYFRIGIEAYNVSTGESFVLQQSNISFNTIPQVGGVYPVNEVLPINTELPTTSVKRDAFLVRDTSIDTGIGYGLKVYYPFLFNWRYWLDQANANADFYPNEQTQNWLPYNTTGAWILRLKMELDRDGENFEYLDQVAMKDYDSDPNIFQSIELRRDLDNALLDVVIEGETHRIVGNNVILSGGSWDQSSVWGMITIETKEKSPRWISSTAIEFDLDTNNPLTPLTGLFCDLTFPTPDNARLECYFDPNKINLDPGIKITIKIKGCYSDGPFDNIQTKMTTTNIQKMTTTGDLKIKTNN